MKVLEAIRARVEARLLKIIPLLDKEVDKIATRFIKDNVEGIVAVVFGFERRWAKEYEVHQYFENSPLAKRLQVIADNAAKEMVEKAVKDFDKGKAGTKRKREWTKLLKAEIEEQYERKMRALVTEYANRYARERSDNDIRELLTRELEDMPTTEAVEKALGRLTTDDNEYFPCIVEKDDDYDEDDDD